MTPDARDRAMAVLADIHALRPVWEQWDPHLTGKLAVPRADLAALADYARWLEADRDRLAAELASFTAVEDDA